MLSAEEIEAQYQARVRQQQYEQQLNKFINPDRDMDLETVWVAYAWKPNGDDISDGEWILAGFRRRRQLRRKQTMSRFFSKVRRKLGIDKKTPVKLYDLGMARRLVTGKDQSWRFHAPQFQVRARKKTMPQITPVIDRRKRKLKAKDRAIIFNPKTTKFIVLGRHITFKDIGKRKKKMLVLDRKPGYLYLGPLRSANKHLATFEAKRLFPLYNDRLIIPVTELSVTLRAALKKNRRVRAGVTRLEWPEVPPTFDMAWARYVKRMMKKEFHHAIEADDPGLLDAKDELQKKWEKEGSPWLSLGWFQRSVNQWSSDACERKTNVSRKSLRAKPSKKTAKKNAGSGKASATSSRTTSRKRSEPRKKARKLVKRATLKNTRPSHAPRKKRVVAVLTKRKSVRAVATRRRIVSAVARCSTSRSGKR